MSTRLSVNVNKIATLRNARGGNNPNLLEHAKNIIHFGAKGITVHPRPDERHITYNDVRELKKNIDVEFNIEGNPKETSFIDLVLETSPEQVTLVPDEIGQLTSNHGWNTNKEKIGINLMSLLLLLLLQVLLEIQHTGFTIKTCTTGPRTNSSQ